MRFDRPMALGVMVASLALSGATFAWSTGGQSGRGERLGVTRLAQTSHAGICKANLDQCEKACDGFAQCIRQCEVNYQGCMAQGG